MAAAAYRDIRSEAFSVWKQETCVDVPHDMHGIDQLGLRVSYSKLM